jgi:hypothetical protein
MESILIAQKSVRKTMFKIPNMFLVEYQMYINIFTTEIYVITPGSCINLIRLLQILFKMARIRVIVCFPPTPAASFPPSISLLVVCMSWVREYSW